MSASGHAFPEKKLQPTNYSLSYHNLQEIHIMIGKSLMFRDFTGKKA
jgi:hypothetical protein